MRIIKHKLRHQRVFIVLTLFLLSLGVVGCAQSGMRIIPVSNQYVLELSAKDVVQIMRSAGFSNMQIMEHGPALRDGLARSGAVQVIINGKPEAVFAIKGSDVYISTLTRGYFIYNVETGWIAGR